MYTGFHASTQLCVALHIALRLLHLGRADVIFLFLLDSCLSISLIREKLLKMLRSLKITQKGKRELLNSDRLQEPINVKKAGRCEKNQYYLLEESGPDNGKKKASRMQIEAGTEPNFLIIMFNNV